MNRIILVFAALALVVLIVLRQFTGNEAVDPKTAIDSSIEQVKAQREISQRDEIRLRIELAWADYMARNGAVPTSLDDLVPTYFSEVPKDPDTGEVFDFASEDDIGSSQPMQVASAASTNVEAIFGDGAFVNPNSMRESEFVYDPTGKRDPFVPFDFSGQSQVNMDLPPLLRYSIGQLKVTAILRDTRDGGYYAMVEDVTGIGYPVRKGTEIGDANGIVVRITEDAVFVVESRTDITGAENRSTVEMKIQRRATDDKNANYQQIRNTK